MGQNLSRQLVGRHHVHGDLVPGEEIALEIDQVLMHDATGPTIALQLEAMGVEQTAVDTVVAYNDHMLVEGDSRNADDHALLRSAARRYGMWHSPVGNGVSHAVHQQRFGVPGDTMLGGDSHTPAAGGIGMLAIGAGGLAISQVLAGEPFRLPMPRIRGIELVGRLPDWVSAKDVILEVLRRTGTDGARGDILEYHGAGVATLSVMDRHVIANMGVETGAYTTVFPSDEETLRYLAAQGREADWQPLAADPESDYDRTDRIDLSQLEPMIARPSSPGDVVPVREVAGRPLSQSYIGSSANPGYRDLAVVAATVADQHVAPGVTLDVNPASRQALRTLIERKELLGLIGSGARLHQTGCNGCIGMGQAPATASASLRTVPRNFPGRSGGTDDQVYLCSPETAVASALAGVITDPRTLPGPYPHIVDPGGPDAYAGLLEPPPGPDEARPELNKGPGHVALPEYDPVPDEVELPVLLHAGDDVSTDEIMPGGTEGASVWSRLYEMTEIAFARIDDTYPARARRTGEPGHAIVGGRNYGQGSSREQAALSARELGLRAVLALSIARIHGENLVNYGVLPLVLDEPAGGLTEGATIHLSGVHEWLQRTASQAVAERAALVVECRFVDGTSGPLSVHHHLTPRQVEILLSGGAIRWLRRRLLAAGVGAVRESRGHLARQPVARSPASGVSPP